MRISKSLLFMAAGISLAALASDDAAPSYTQSYTIFLNGAPAGSETVVEHVLKDGKVLSTSTHDIMVTDGLETKRMAFTTTMTLQKGSMAPTQYACKYSSGDAGDSYEVTLRDGQIIRSLTRAGKTVEASLPLTPGFVIVDFNVYHHYDYLYRRYDLKKGGRQVFQNFLPLIASETPIALTRLEDSQFTAVKGSLQTHNFKVDFIGSWMGVISFDKSGRLVRLVLQDKGLEVVRKDLLPAAVELPN